MRAPPIGCGRRFLVTMNGEPFSGFDDEKQAYEIAKMYNERGKSNDGKYRFEVRTQVPNDALDPCKNSK